MDQYRVCFESMPWEQPAAGVRFKAYEQDGRRLRLAEFTKEFVEADWCTKGHIGYVLEGEMEIDFHGHVVTFQGRGRPVHPGRKRTWAQGEGADGLGHSRPGGECLSPGEGNERYRTSSRPPANGTSSKSANCSWNTRGACPSTCRFRTSRMNWPPCRADMLPPSGRLLLARLRGSTPSAAWPCGKSATASAR